jgi:hypothetical protein
MSKIPPLPNSKERKLQKALDKGKYRKRVIKSGELMSKPGETDSGKGSFNRISNSKLYGDHYDNIDFGHPNIKFISSEDWECGAFDWYDGEGYYFGSDKLRPQGPYNSPQKARSEMQKFLQN